MWDSGIEWVAGASAPWIFCSIIAFAFAYTLIDGWWRLSSASMLLSRGIRTIQSTASRTQFFKEYESIREEFTRQPMFAASWAEFDKTILVNDQRELLLITRRPYEFFNEQGLISPRINLRLYQAFPGYLISLGLFFTFVGLVAAIAIAAKGLDAGTVEEAQKSLVQLLQVASVKFISSVAGISFSILLSIVQKSHLNRIHALIHGFCAAIESRTQLTTTEQLLYDWLKTQQDSSRQLQHLAEDIATEVAIAIAPESKEA